MPDAEDALVECLIQCLCMCCIQTAVDCCIGGCCDTAEPKRGPQYLQTPANPNGTYSAQQPLNPQSAAGYPNQQNSYQPYPAQPYLPPPQDGPYNDAYHSLHMPPPIVHQPASAPPSEVYRPSMSNQADPSAPPPSYSEAVGLEHVTPNVDSQAMSLLKKT